MSNWGNKEAAEEYKPKGGGGFWGKLEEGDNKLRLVSDYRYIGYHWQGQGRPSVTCLNQGKGDDKCALCRTTKEINGKIYPNTPSAKFVVNCIDLDGENTNIKHYEFPYAVIDAINGYALDPEYKFTDLPGWDMVVTKETKGEKKVDYKVRAARQNRDLTPEEEAMIEGFEAPEEVVKFKLDKQAEESGLDSQPESKGTVVTGRDDDEPKAETKGTTQAQADDINLDDLPF